MRRPRKRFARIVHALDASRRRTVALGVLVVLLVGTLDHATGIEVSFSIFYMPAVALVAWFAGVRWGIATSALACATWYVNDTVIGNHAYAHPAIPVWNAIMRGLVFSILALLAARMRHLLMREQRAFHHLETAFDELDRARIEQLLVKDRVLSHVSHELRTPLTALHQFLTILRDDLAGPLNPQQREYVDIAVRNAEQLRRMIGDLLESTRAGTGKLSITAQPMDLGPAADDIVRTLRSPAAEAGIELVVAVPHDLPAVMADPGRVRQVLVNLLDNALKFTPGPGRVVISAASDEQAREVRVSVSDTGRGISPEGVAQVFSRLYQEGSGGDASRRGLGLGLHICRELITRMGGRIWAQSALGQGTTMSFTLPMAAEGD